MRRTAATRRRRYQGPEWVRLWGCATATPLAWGALERPDAAAADAAGNFPLGADASVVLVVVPLAARPEVATVVGSA